MNTLIVDLDQRIAASSRPDFHGVKTVAEHWRRNDFQWWEEALRTNPSYAEQQKAIEEWLCGWSFPRILELGPCTGRVTRILAPVARGPLQLVEVNERHYQQLRAEFPNADIHHADLTQLKWHRQIPFSLIAVVEVLVHIPNVEELMRRIHHALSPEGQALVSITPLTWYQEHYKEQPTVHRGIDRQEFEEFVSKMFRFIEVHTSTSGQHITYWLEKI